MSYSGTFFVLLVCGPILPALAANDLPHIIFILADDMGWNDVGWVNPNMYTPNLDRLAREGIILKQSYVQKLCSPSRGALMSGYYPYHIGLQHAVILARQAVGLPTSLTTLPQALKAKGYSTHMAGKWHLGFCNWDYTPMERGFDTFLGFFCPDETYTDHRLENSYDFRFNKEINYENDGQYSTHVFRDRAIDVIRSRNKSVPLFLYLPFQAVHYPLEVPRRYSDQYCSYIENDKRRTYCGMAAALDEAVGDIVDVLESEGITDNMLLIFSSDNGGDPEYGASNLPLRGAKGTLWEGGSRAVGFVYSQNLFNRRGVEHNGMMHIVDWFPTLMTLVNGTIPEGIDGVSQWTSLVNGGDSPRQEFVYNVDDIDNNAAIRWQDWKLIQGNPGWYRSSEEGIGVKDVGGIGEEDDDYMLFNLRDDPYERKDVKADFPEILDEMKQRMMKWKRSQVPANFPADDPKSDPKRYFNDVWSPGWC